MEKRKSIIFKDVTDKGIVVAAFATLNVIDKHGDVTLPGFFGKQNVSMLPAHAWGHVPIGKGTIHESGDQAIAEIKMNLDIPAAKDWHSALMFDMKNGEPLQEWSYGFDILSGGSSHGEQDGHSVRFLQPAHDGSPGSKVHEVSPVLVGAGEDTATLTVKGGTRHEGGIEVGEGRKGTSLAAAMNNRIESMTNDERSRSDIVQAMARAARIEIDTVNAILTGGIVCPPLNRLGGFARVLSVSAGTLRRAAERDGCDYSNTSSIGSMGAKFGDELSAVLAAVESVEGRAKSLAEMRVKEGRGLSAEGLGRLKSLHERLGSLGGSLSSLMTDDDARKRAQQELRRLKMQELGRRAGVKFQISKEQ